MKVSRFTPSLMKPEELEEIFVQREDLARHIVELIRDSVLTPSKHHTLLIGPRGIGKTHLVSLIYHRIRKMDNLGDRLLIAWLREEEWGITSFLDLLLRIFRALQEEYGNPPQSPLTKGRQEGLGERVESLYELPPDAAESEGAALLKEFIGNRTLLLVMENLDEVFAGLGDEGQRRLRAFLQENAVCTILATSPSLFNGVKLQTSPFYGFFRICYLEDLMPEDATQLLANISKLEGKRDLESFIQTPTGRDRIQAVHHLAGGSHRVYVIFSEFLTCESLDELVEPFMRTLDDLTPYYQARMAYISPQQRKIIEFLCDHRHPVPVKDIAQRCFMTHQTASGQLKDLREKGYVTSESIGRESYYELREVLMRFCLEVKKQRGEPIRLFVDFLRLWYTRTELQQRLDMLPADAELDRDYVLHALRASKAESEDPRVAALMDDYEAYFEKKDFVHALQVAEGLVAIRGCAWDWFNQGYCLDELGRYEEALVVYDKAIDLDPIDWTTWFNRGVTLDKLERYEEALASYDQAIELDLNEATAWEDRGWGLGKLGRYEEALASYDQAIELDPKYVRAWNNRGWVLSKLERYEEALASYDQAIELDPKSARAWKNRGWVLSKLERYEEALASYNQAIELDPKSARAWKNRGWALRELGRYNEALASCNQAIELDPNYASAWNNRGWVLEYLGRYEEALASYDQAIELTPKYATVWKNRGWVLGKLERYNEALASYDQVIELDSNDATAWKNRSWVLGKLERYNEALACCDHAIELDPNYASAWFTQGWVLEYLGRYDEALLSYNKAIELGKQSSHVFFNRVEVLLVLNRWEESSAALDDALHRFTHADEPDTGDTEAIIRNLFNSTHKAPIWCSRIKTLIEIYDKHQVASALRKGIVRSIPALMSPMVSDVAAQTWRDVWRELVCERTEFQISLRLLNAAVRYRETKGDPRVLLELPIEERNLLKPLLGIEEP